MRQTWLPARAAMLRVTLGARIVFACDAFDAMIEDRAYRKGMPFEDALRELEVNAGTQFDPTVVGALCATLQDRSLAATA